jgi:ornithine carbamoyltransferase
MKKTLFIALFGMLFLVACSSQNKQKEAAVEEATEVIEATEEAVEEVVEEAEEAVEGAEVPAE